MSIGSGAPLEVLLADLALFDRVGEAESQARCLLRISEQRLGAGQRLLAARAARLGLEAADGDQLLRGRLFAQLAQVLAQAGHPGGAIACYERADSALRLAKQPQAACAAALAACILLSGRSPDETRRRVLALLEELVATAAPELFAEALGLLGDLELEQGEWPAALLCAETAMTAAALIEPSSSSLLARLSGLQGAALGGLGRDEAAAPLLQVAVSGIDGAVRPSALGRALEWQGHLLARRGQLQEARARWREALRLRQQARHAGPAVGLALRLAESYPDNGAEATRYLLGALDWLARLPRPATAELARARGIVARLPPSVLLQKLEQRLRELG